MYCTMYLRRNYLACTSTTTCWYSYVLCAYLLVIFPGRVPGSTETLHGDGEGEEEEEEQEEQEDQEQKVLCLAMAAAEAERQLPFLSSPAGGWGD